MHRYPGYTSQHSLALLCSSEKGKKGEKVSPEFRNDKRPLFYKVQQTPARDEALHNSHPLTPGRDRVRNPNSSFPDLAQHLPGADPTGTAAPGPPQPPGNPRSPGWSCPLHPGAARAPNRREPRGRNKALTSITGTGLNPSPGRAAQRPRRPEPAPNPGSRECPGLCPGERPPPVPALNPGAPARANPAGAAPGAAAPSPGPAAPGYRGMPAVPGAVPALPRCRREPRPGRAHLRWPLR